MLKLAKRTVLVIDNLTTGDNARRLRQAKGKSLRTVASKLKFSPAYLSDLERGRRGWNEILLERFERALR